MCLPSWEPLEPSSSAQLQPATVRAFDDYIRTAEARLEPPGGFLWVDQDPARVKQVRAGQLISQPWGAKAETAVEDGLIHDWIGAAFIPGATLDKTLALVQDYDHHKDVYKPEVLDSKLVKREGQHFQIFLRLLKKKVLTVVLDTYHDVTYTRIDARRCRTKSYTTKICEVENPGKRDERDLPPDEGHGFLWRLYSYWRFEERDGGVYIECEAISLTRGVPTGLGWIVEPIIRTLPRDSLANTLRSTRDGVLRMKSGG